MRGTWVVHGFCDFVKFSIKRYREIAKNHEKSLFGHLDPFNDFFRQIHPYRPPWNNFSNVLEKKFLTTFPKFWHMTSFLPPKTIEFGTFSSKMTYFYQIDPINDYFGQFYVHKPDWNNFYKLLEKKLFYHFPQIVKYDVILAPKICQNDPILTNFTNNDLFWQNWPH